ncbi:MAG: hypothetical protein ACI9V8_001180 [Urechidicola sp.]|jgi:hypothetical protein
MDQHYLEMLEREYIENKVQYNDILFPLCFELIGYIYKQLIVGTNGATLPRVNQSLKRFVSYRLS